jgi:hypothetical protein
VTSGAGSLAAITLVAATAVHLGFQMVVTFLVYPAFAEVPDSHWQRYHAAHSRRITPLVVVVYGALVAASGWALVADPGAATLVAVGAALVATAITAAVAAPAHGRLTDRRGERDLRVLVAADRGRTAAALVAFVAATAAVLD